MDEQNHILEKRRILIQKIILKWQWLVWILGIAWAIFLIYIFSNSNNPYIFSIICSLIGSFTLLQFFSLEAYFWPKLFLSLANFFLIILPFVIISKKDLPSNQADLLIYIFGCIFFLFYNLCFICSLINQHKESSLNPKDL